MPLVTIVKPFHLLQEDNEVKKFYPGPQHITDEENAHWYVKVHLEDNAITVASPGTWEFAEQMRQQSETLRKQRDEDAVSLKRAQDEVRSDRDREAVSSANKSIKTDAKAALTREVLRKRA